jgi:hypothetical protein
MGKSIWDSDSDNSHEGGKGNEFELLPGEGGIFKQGIHRGLLSKDLKDLKK